MKTGALSYLRVVSSKCQYVVGVNSKSLKQNVGLTVSIELSVPTGVAQKQRRSSSCLSSASRMAGSGEVLMS